jgi:3-oxoacyl-[acyl-carrier-protein] synthase-3
MVTLLGSAVFHPQTFCSSDQIDSDLQLASGTALKMSGVGRRPRAGSMTLSGMAGEAAKAALKEAGLGAGDLDLILFAGASFEQILPCTAAFVQRELGDEARGVPCFDINSTCLSYLTALQTAQSFLQSGNYATILVVNAEIASQHLNPEHRESYFLFGDGATAFVFSSRAAPSALSFELSRFRMETYAEEIEACGIRGGGSALNVFQLNSENRGDYRFWMDGPRLFKKAAQLLPAFMDRLLGETPLADVRWVVPHQASGSAMKLIRRRLGIPEERWIDILYDHGNQISVSIPMAFHTLLESGQVRHGDTILLVGTGAGLALAGALLTVRSA